MRKQDFMKRLAYALTAHAMVFLAACGSSPAPDPSIASTSCPVEGPVPDYSAGYRCYGDLAGNPRPPVLLIPGTTLTPETSFSWNWFRALDALGRAYCTITLGDHGMNDIQDSAEYMNYAIRETYRRGGDRRIQVLGHSQGGMISRWVFKYAPDTRGMVEDLVGWAPSNHGTVLARGICAQECAPAIWQQRDDARFIAALNNGPETYPEIDYTSIYSYTDEVVVPNTPPAPSSALSGGENVSNIAIQEVCPAFVSEHLSVATYDPVAYALTLDALDHPGPAKRDRISLSTCAALFQPGVDPATFAADYAAFTGEIAEQLQTYPRVTAEPPLKCYAAADAP
jgi:pimeloyl-ACP methyl ester carboxylesterase